MIWSSIALVVVLAVGVAAVWAAHIPGLREWTGAAPLEREPDEQADEPGATLAEALGNPEYLHDLPTRHNHTD